MRRRFEEESGKLFDRDGAEVKAPEKMFPDLDEKIVKYPWVQNTWPEEMLKLWEERKKLAEEEQQRGDDGGSVSDPAKDGAGGSAFAKES